jgi:hypothetical protein
MLIREKSSLLIEPHPLAALIPPPTPEQYQKLLGDIRENGLREKIVLLEGKGLDGNTRARILIALGIAITPDHVRHFDPATDGATPLAFMLSKNLYRRHLTTGQRALIVEELAKGKVGDNQHTREGVGTATGSKVAGVSRDTVQTVRKLKKTAIPEVLAALKAGEISVHRAEQIAQLDPADQFAQLAASEESETVEESKPKRSRKTRTIQLPLEDTLKRMGTHYVNKVCQELDDRATDETERQRLIVMLLKDFTRLRAQAKDHFFPQTEMTPGSKPEVTS